MVQQMSILAYKEIQDLGARQRQVLNIIRSRGFANNLEIAKDLGLPINSVTPRTNELVAKGLVQESHKDYCPITGKLVIFWEEKHETL